MYEKYQNESSPLLPSLIARRCIGIKLYILFGWDLRFFVGFLVHRGSFDDFLSLKILVGCLKPQGFPGVEPHCFCQVLVFDSPWYFCDLPICRHDSLTRLRVSCEPNN